MSEKLTVAELLARSGRTSSDSGRRRRRRSLDEGGISVAELTGAIPVVEDTESEASTAPGPGDDKRERPTADRAEAGVKQAEKVEKAKQAKAAEEAAAPAEKTCPFCRSTIAVEATRCPHCTSHLTED